MGSLKEGISGISAVTIQKCYCGCVTILVFLVVIFGWVGQNAIIDNSPFKLQSKFHCEKIANGGGTCTPGPDGSSQCDVDPDHFTCRDPYIKKQCIVFSSHVVERSDEVEAEVGGVDGTLVDLGGAQVGYQETELDKRCGISAKCEPDMDLLEEVHNHSPMVPYTVIWGFYKLIGLTSLAVAVGLVPEVGKHMFHGVNTFTSFGWLLEFYPEGWKFASAAGMVRSGLKKGEWIFFYFKYVIAPNILVAELTALKGHPDCDAYTLSTSLPDAAQLMYYTLFSYTSVLITLIPVMCSQPEFVEIKDDGWEYNKEANHGCAWRYTMLAMLCFFGIDIVMLVTIFIWGWSALLSIGFTFFFGVSYAFEFDVKASVSIDVFQLFLATLTVMQTVESLLNIVKKTVARATTAQERIPSAA